VSRFPENGGEIEKSQWWKIVKGLEIKWREDECYLHGTISLK
jgi:hypothetical protein